MNISRLFRVRLSHHQTLNLRPPWSLPLCPIYERMSKAILMSIQGIQIPRGFSCISRNITVRVVAIGCQWKNAISYQTIVVRKPARGSRICTKSGLKIGQYTTQVPRTLYDQSTRALGRSALLCFHYDAKSPTTSLVFQGFIFLDIIVSAALVRTS